MMHIIHTKNVLTYIEYSPSFKGFNVVEFGEETTNRSPQVGVLTYRNNYILHFVLDGNGIFCRDGKTYQLSKGKAFVITPHNLIRYASVPSENWTYCWIAFSGTDCEKLFRQCGFNDETAVFDFTEEDIAPLSRFLDLIRNDPPVNASSFAMEVYAMSYNVLSKCAFKLCRNEAKSEKLSSSIIDTAIAYIQENYDKPINVSTLCTALNVSRSYFSTLFESVLRQTPYRYLQNIRVQRASELLVNDKHLHIGEIAEAVGFASVAQFCKVFKKFTGRSPSQFRNVYAKQSDQ